MREKDLLYWLQGFFEITESGEQEIKSFIPEQVAAIQRHINLVRESKRDSGLCIALEAILKLSENAPMYSFEAIKSIISSYFQHVIDPKDEEGKTEEDVQKLNEIHFSPSHLDKDTLIRC